MKQLGVELEGFLQSVQQSELSGQAENADDAASETA
jgi:hypothetical protein